jgi:L-histidine N-alpha-methyltransferase
MRGSAAITIQRYADPTDLPASLAADVWRGLAKRPRQLPSKYFYDARGAVLFQRICELPEYYLPRAELAILERAADAIVEECRPSALIELGSGDSMKTRELLDAMRRAGSARLYVPIDLSEDVLVDTARKLAVEYAGMRVSPIVADFEQPLRLPDHEGPRLVIFLGSTIGNFERDAAVRFLRGLGGQLGRADRFALGVDLVKDVRTLERAYNDRAGVTAAFNLNLLTVLNTHLGATFDPGRFEHRAFYDVEAARIEMHVVAREAHRVRIPALGMELALGAGESIRTEISCKYTRESVAAMFEAAGLRLCEWYTDEERLFGVALAGVARESGP